MGTPVSSGNRGILALGASLVSLCSEAAEGSAIFLLLEHRNNQSVSFRVRKKLELIPVVNGRISPRARLCDHFGWILAMSILYRLVPWRRFRAGIENSTPWIGAVAQAGMVGDVRGGDSFSDIYGMERFLMGFVAAWSVILVKGSIVQFPQTYGPFKRPIARIMARFLLRRSSVIIARDKQSLQVAQNLVGPEKVVILSPDVAFSLESVRPKQIELSPPLIGPVPASVIGLNVNGLMYNGGYTRNNMFGLRLDYTRFLQDVIPALLNENSGELWLIPHTYAPLGKVESDNDASTKVRDALPAALRDRVRVVSAEYDQHELKGIIGECDFFVGSRMHACIAALSQGVPCVGVAYSMKFAGVFDSVGMQGWVVDARDATTDQAVAQVVSLFRQRNAVRSDLSKRSAWAGKQLQTVFRNLVEKIVDESSQNKY